MENHYLLWASGEDRPGLVAAITQSLAKLKCNIEDSSMMRLGSEFGVLLIFTSQKFSSAQTLEEACRSLSRNHQLQLGIKKITESQARFRPTKKPLYSVVVHGGDKTGLVYKVTQVLSSEKFNITDLSTHRTTDKKNPGFILIIEGEMSQKNPSRLKKKLASLSKSISTHITLNPISLSTL